MRSALASGNSALSGGGATGSQGSYPWYVQAALTVRRGQASLLFLCGLLAAGAIGCGDDRQDADETDASFDVAVVKADFPTKQRLAQQANLEITVRNDDTETIPNIAVTVDGFFRRSKNQALADPNRPVFLLDGEPRDFGGYPDVKVAAPKGGATALVNTWALGPLEPGDERTFRWRVTAVKAGPFKVTYTVAGGLQGKAKAVGAGGAQPQGEFAGSITSRPPASRIAADGVTVITPAP
jgi:hypothetical protein